MTENERLPCDECAGEIPEVRDGRKVRADARFCSKACRFAYWNRRNPRRPAPLESSSRREE